MFPNFIQFSYFVSYFRCSISFYFSFFLYFPAPGLWLPGTSQCLPCSSDNLNTCSTISLDIAPRQLELGQTGIFLLLLVFGIRFFVAGFFFCRSVVYKRREKSWERQAYQIIQKAELAISGRMQIEQLDSAPKASGAVDRPVAATIPVDFEIHFRTNLFVK